MSCWFCRLVISFSVVDGSKFVFIYEHFPRSTRNFDSFISLEYVRHESEKKHWQNEATSHAEKLLFSIINCSNIPSDRPPHSEKWRISNNTKILRDILGIYKNFLILLIFLSLSLYYKFIQVTANDADVDRPNNIIYFLTGPGINAENPSESNFDINKATGEIFVLKVSWRSLSNSMKVGFIYNGNSCP